MKHMYTFLWLLLLSGVVSADISGMALISDGDTITMTSTQTDSNVLERTGIGCGRLHYGSTPDDSNKVTGEENHQVLEFTDENWWARKDSNLRPMDYESTALTN